MRFDTEAYCFPAVHNPIYGGLLMLRAGTDRIWETERWLAPSKFYPNKKLKQSGLDMNVAYQIL